MSRPKPDPTAPTSPAPAGEVAPGAGEDPAVERSAGEGSRAARTAALALLAGRDFSCHELTARLLRKGHDPSLVEATVAELVREGLLREERYVEQFVRQHGGRGRGPVRIRAHLREKGVESTLIDQGLDEAATDWIQSARDARRRRFGPSPPGDYRERAKQARFLQYRGFSSDQIRAALGPDEDDPDHDT